LARSAFAGRADETSPKLLRLRPAYLDGLDLRRAPLIDR
jgi:hypothetical protein